ncbi:MAG: Ldh family oxidoreductase [Planctomycetes bacterium]|nr:Ldh family oxidoreductase [Planctomycetota bacterium]
MSEIPDYPLDAAQEIIVPAEPLKALLVSMYVKKGMFKAEAEMAAARQIEADLRGIQSHGSRATPRYLKAMDTGDIDPRGQTLVLKKTAAIAVLDGGRNLGHVASTRAIQMAIEMAKATGTGTVAVKNSQHFGAASVYSLLAAEAGMIGYCTTSTGGATVAAYGSATPATANNAFAWAAPVKTGAPFCLDMACAVSSWGKVHALGMYGRQIPSGWALDANGHPTVDPNQSKTLLPASGPRGYGLAFLSSILAGTLQGGKMPLHKTRSPEAEGSEHFFYVIDVDAFGEADKYFAEMERTIAEIRALPTQPGFDRVTLPGEIEWDRAQARRASGIPIHRDHLRELGEVATRMKLSVPWSSEAGQ